MDERHARRVRLVRSYLVLPLVLQDHTDDPPRPRSAPFRTDALGVELSGDVVKPDSARLLRGEPGDDLLLAGHRHQHPAPFLVKLRRQLVPVRRWPESDSLGLDVLHRLARPLEDHLPLELVVVRQVHHEHAPGGTVGVDHAADRQEVIALIGEVVAHQRAHVAQRAREPVQLDHDQRVGRPAPDPAQRRLQAGPL